jgi:hypothetical protein
MSNRSLHDRIGTVLASDRAGDATLSELKDAVLQNGRAMEAMPDELARNLGELEYLFSVTPFYDEDVSLPMIGCNACVSRLFGEL